MSIAAAWRGIAVMVAAAVCAAGPARAADEKIATWNLDWLTLRPAGDAALPDNVHPRRPQDFDRLRGYADKLDADVIAFQEVDGIAAASRVFDPERYTLLTIDEAVVQQVGLAVRHGITVQRHPDLAALDVEPAAPHRLRAGLDATLVFPGGTALRVLAIHLKTGCHTDDVSSSTRPQCALLAQQIPVLAAWIAARAAEGVPFIVLGDFNRVMDQPEAISQALQQAAPLLRANAGQSDPCWDGQPFIDQILAGGPARDWLVPGSLRVMTYRGADPRDRDRLSDHCPVSVHLAVPGNGTPGRR
jgi:endonuclease/exonuclease/phosphatase family metal-dependent hydrolase